MKNPTHAPGPWKVRLGVTGLPMIVTKRGWMLAQASSVRNAELIAAAPELLKACESALALITEHHPDFKGATHFRLLESIKKARGEK